MVMRKLAATLVVALSTVSAAIGQSPENAAPPASELLFEAARAGDIARVDAALARGADVNATSRYNVTPLIYAAGNGRADAVKLLVARGADVNAEDSFYRFSAGEIALYNGHNDIALFLLQNGWKGADDLLLFGVRLDSAALVKTALESDPTRPGLQTALKMAEGMKRASLLPTLKAALDALPTSAAGAATVDKPAAPVAPIAPVAPVAPVAVAPRNWSSFRGDAAAGNGDGQRAVAEWDVTTGKNIKWKTPIPGIANSSPVVWGHRVFVTTAISKAGDRSFRTGLYGDVKPVDDLSEHEWKIYALDKATGKTLWERTAFSGAPKIKRHTKATQANSTPATNGRRVVAVFGTIGLLVAWDMSGKELWRADLGALDTGWFLDPTFQWGHSSSPVIYKNSVILQADVQKGSYVAAWNLDTGKQIWKAARPDEISTWGTPAIFSSASGRSELVTNGTKVRGYDPDTGTPLWSLGPNSEITVGTPVAGHGLVFVTGGYPPVRPIYAIRPGATGDISLPKGTESNQAIAWSNMTEGTYIPTPVVYRDHLITVANNGVVTFYDARTGQRGFRGRVGQGGAFSASPVVADGRLYLASEDGEVHVVSADAGLTPIAKNDMKEVVMATPAISDGVIVVRTLGHVYGIGAVP